MADRAKRIQNVTIKDVAQEAGVSYATVSRVLNHNKHVRPEKRQRVLDTITRLGYVVNQQARSLAGGNSQVIGLVAPNLSAGYMGEVLSGVDAELSTAPYDLMLYTTQHRKMKEAIYAQTLTRGMTDGLLLLLPLNPGAYLETLHAQKFPYVVIDNQGFDDFSPTVVGTNWQGAYDATHYLIKLGHRRIGFIGGMPGLISAAERLSGYKAALKTYGITFDPELVANGNFNQPEGYTAAEVLLDLPELPTAIFAANDLSALGVLDAVRNRGLTVPDDISVMGFDDIQQAAFMRPGLTTVRQPLAEMGQIAVRMLLEYIEKPDLPMQRIEVETELMIRETCCPPKTS